MKKLTFHNVSFFNNKTKLHKLTFWNHFLTIMWVPWDYLNFIKIINFIGGFRKVSPNDTRGEGGLAKVSRDIWMAPMVYALSQIENCTLNACFIRDLIV